MLNWIKTYMLAIVSTLTVVSVLGNALLGTLLYFSSEKNDDLSIQLGIVAAASTNQEVKIVEAKHTEEKIKVVYQDKIKVVKEYVYDNNKSDCENAIDLMRTTF